MVLHAKYTKDAAAKASCLAWAQTQVDYMLGLKGSDRWVGAEGGWGAEVEEVRRRAVPAVVCCASHMLH
jgi:hypothetical protein